MALRTENTSNGFHVEFNDQRRGSATSTGSIDTLEIPIQLDNSTNSKPKGRTRSNSRIYNNSTNDNLWISQPVKPSLPSSSPISLSSSPKQSSALLFNNNGILNDNKPDMLSDMLPDMLPERNDSRSSLIRKVTPRENFIYVLILTSLNETFDRKTLKIPTYPEVLKLGRPNSSQRAPSVYNGYFDSRVISREHAEIYVKDGGLFINDLNSANGTFVNNNKILKEEVINIGDAIDLGIDIASENKHQHQHQQHKKISCNIENFLTLSVDGTTDTSKVLAEFNKKTLIDKNDSTIELSPFDAGMFGDVSNDLEDLTLGINHDFLPSIFVNNNINTSSNLIKPIKLLMNQLHQEKLNNIKLKSVENFLENYKLQLGKDIDLSKLRKSKKELEDYKNKTKTLIDELKSMRLIINQHENMLTKANDHIQLKDKKLEEIERRLHNAKSKNIKTDLMLKELELLIKQKDIFINSLQEQQFKTIITLEDEIKVLKDKIDLNNAKIKELEEFKESAIKSRSSNETYYEIYRTGFIITGVLAVGLTLLKLF